MREKDTKELFEGLVYNAIDFLKHALNEKQLTKNPKYSLLNFVSGIELILKARLMHEHWSLILEDPSKADFSKFKEGDFKSINSTVALERIKKILNEKMRHDHFGEIEFIRKHRNKLMHFYEPAYFSSHNPQHRQKIEKVVAEQFRTWYRLNLILNNEWREKFEPFIEDFSKINKDILKNRKFLNAKFNELTEKLKKLKNGGYYIIKCGVHGCGFDAAVANDVTEGEATYGQIECLVCEFKGWAIIIFCKECSNSIVYQNLDDAITCECGRNIDIDNMIRENFKLCYTHYEDKHSDFTIICSSCESEFVVNFDEKYLCLKCLEEFHYVVHCEYCTQRYVNDNYHALEGSWLGGCGMCSGKGFDD